MSLDKAENEVLGQAAKVVLTKETTTIVGDGTTQEAVNKRVVQIKNLIEVWPQGGFIASVCQFAILMGSYQSKSYFRQLNKNMKRRNSMKELLNFLVELP